MSIPTNITRAIDHVDRLTKAKLIEVLVALKLDGYGGAAAASPEPDLRKRGKLALVNTVKMALRSTKWGTSARKLVEERL